VISPPACEWSPCETSAPSISQPWATSPATPPIFKRLRHPARACLCATTTSCAGVQRSLVSALLSLRDRRTLATTRRATSLPGLNGRPLNFSSRLTNLPPPPTHPRLARLPFFHHLSVPAARSVQKARVLHYSWSLLSIHSLHQALSNGPMRSPCSHPFPVRFIPTRAGSTSSIPPISLQHGQRWSL
jgi:hypothetical protein